MVVVASSKDQYLRLDVREISKGLARPERFTSTKQTQPQHPTDDQSARMTVAKRSFVVELMNPRQSEFLPSPEQMRAGGRTGFVQALYQSGSLREQIERMKLLNLQATTDMFGDDIRGVNCIYCPDWQPQVVSVSVAAPNECVSSYRASIR